MYKTFQSKFTEMFKLFSMHYFPGSIYMKVYN